MVGWGDTQNTNEKQKRDRKGTDNVLAHDIPLFDFSFVI